jgi:hypothetical protein
VKWQSAENGGAVKIIASMMLVALGCGFAYAGTSDDESALRSLYVCSRTYKELPQLTYESDIAKLDRLTVAVHAELGKKYSTRDVDLMKSKATDSAAKENVKEFHLKFCSEMMQGLQNNKSGLMKSYLIKTE